MSLLVLLLYNNKEHCLEQFICLFSLDLPTAVGSGVKSALTASRCSQQQDQPQRAPQHAVLTKCNDLLLTMTDKND